MLCRKWIHMCQSLTDEQRKLTHYLALDAHRLLDCEVWEVLKWYEENR